MATGGASLPLLSLRPHAIAVIELYRQKYLNANFAHFTQLLAKHEDIFLSESSIRAILESEYILSPMVTKAKQKRMKKELRDRQKDTSG